MTGERETNAPAFCTSDVFMGASPAISIRALSRAFLALPWPPQLGNHTLAVSPYELLLVAPDVMHVDLVEAKVHVVLDVFEMLVEVRGRQNAVLEVIDVDQLRHRREVLGISDVGLGERHSAVGPLLDGLLLGFLLALGPGDVQLDHSRHEARILVFLPRAFFELLHEHLYLLVRGADGYDPVAEPPRALAHDR